MSAAEFAGGPDPNLPTPAATVACLRPGAQGPEVLLLRRRAAGTFGGMWVFPGGKVDPEDRGPTDDDIAAGRNAAVREAAEEAGVAIDPASLVVLSFWLPPPETARRFSTWFFLAPVAGVDPIVLSQDEMGDHRWQRPIDTLAAHAAGEVQLAPPTWTTLWWLRDFPAVDDALAAAAARPPERYLTRAAFTPGGELAATLWEGDVAYDDLDIDPRRPGPRRRLQVGSDGWAVLLEPVVAAQ